jgi:hypothetical protein
VPRPIGSATANTDALAVVSLADLVTTIIPLGRPGTRQEAAGAIFVLCNFVQRQVLTVSGGQMAGMTS